jgi:hypothetical protein
MEGLFTKLKYGCINKHNLHPERKMKKRITGDGGLSRKLLAILMASGMLSSGALANDVYIEQIGDNSSISITQTGAGNMVNGNLGGLGNADDAALIRGDLNDVTINQIGSGNILSLILNNESNGTGSTVVISADGSNNTQNVSCGTALSSSCNASIIRSEITGNNNNTVQTLSGGAVQSKIAVNGNYNNVTHTASGVGQHSGEITVSGSGTSSVANAVTLTQSGALTKNAVITSNGSNNNVIVTQSD